MNHDLAQQQAVTAGLRLALREQGRWGDVLLQVLPDRGLAHLHVRLGDTGVLARVPKQSQLGLAPGANLRHQAACFERAQPGGRTPRLIGLLPVSCRLPWGALLVEEIAGRPARLPDDLPAIAQALAALHALPLPAGDARPPLASPADALAPLVVEIQAQAAHLAGARLVPAARRLLVAELAWLEQLLHRPGRPGRHLISFDTHPGNFVVRAPGDAVLVDLEKCRYGHPGLDLAHATLYTSTTWDVATRAVLSNRDVTGFYDTWAAAVGPAIAAAARPWQMALRRAMWLWSVTWCCKWRVLSGRPPASSPAGEDWSAAASDAALAAHVRERVDHYLALPTLERGRCGLRALEQAFAA